MDPDVEDAAAALVVLYAVAQQRSSRIYKQPYIFRRFKWIMDEVPLANFEHLFRFQRDEIIRLIDLLRINTIDYRNGNRPPPDKALCIFLNRLAYPKSLIDSTLHFGHSRGYCSEVFNDVAMHIADTFGHVVAWRRCLNNHDVLEAFAEAIYGAGSGYGVWGFIDGTFQYTARPSIHQEDYYSGHKGSHGIKWQGIVTPDGLICAYGPARGSQNDQGMLVASGLEDRLDEIRGVRDPSEFVHLLGDSGYTVTAHIWVPFKHHLGRAYLTEEEAIFNVHLSSYRIDVEHAFGRIFNNWCFLSFKKHVRLLSSPVSAYMTAAVLLTNCLTCLRGNQISQKYEQWLNRVDLEAYLWHGE